MKVKNEDKIRAFFGNREFTIRDVQRLLQSSYPTALHAVSRIHMLGRLARREAYLKPNTTTFIYTFDRNASGFVSKDEIRNNVRKIQARKRKENARRMDVITMNYHIEKLQKAFPNKAFTREEASECIERGVQTAHDVLQYMLKENLIFRRISKFADNKSRFLYAFRPSLLRQPDNYTTLLERRIKTLELMCLTFEDKPFCQDDLKQIFNIGREVKDGVYKVGLELHWLERGRRRWNKQTSYKFTKTAIDHVTSCSHDIDPVPIDKRDSLEIGLVGEARKRYEYIRSLKASGMKSNKIHLLLKDSQ